MSEEVAVEPERLNELASALEHLRDVLAVNVPTIIGTLNQYWSAGQGTPISLSPLQQAQAQSVDDASDMRERSNMAFAWENKPGPCLADGMIAMPWLTGDQLNAASEAELLTKAEKESAKNPKAARKQIQAIEAQIQQHVNAKDTTWLQAFYNDASPQVANLAAVLNREDGQNGVVLTKQDEQILNTYATGLAYADKNGTLDKGAINAYANAKNLWSVGMLFKFGPPGSAYGTQEPSNLLAKVTTSIELARLTGGYTIPLTSSQLSHDWGSASTSSLQEFDPSQAMLTLATQNGIAASEVLGDKANLSKSDYKIIEETHAGLLKPGQQVTIGQAIAAGLMLSPTTGYFPNLGKDGTGSLQGFYPNPFQSSADLKGQGIPALTVSPNAIGDFFNAATSAPRGATPAAQEAALSAMNIIDATPPPSTVSVPEPVRQALLKTADRYMLDLAQSTSNKGTSGSAVLPAGQQLPGMYALQIAGEGGTDPLDNFLQQICANQRDATALNAAEKVEFGNLYAQKSLNPELMKTEGFPIDQATLDMARLLGKTQTDAYNVGINLATNADEQHEEYNQIIALGVACAPFLPKVGDAVDSGTDPAEALAGLVGLPTEFSTNNQALAEQQDTQNFGDASTQLHVAMVQGLLNAGAPDLMSSAEQANGQLPKQYQWLHNGQLTLDETNYSYFEGWYQGQAAEMYNLGNLENSYSWAYYQQGVTSSQNATGVW